MDFKYVPPGGLSEFSEEGLKNWHKLINRRMSESYGPPTDQSGTTIINGGSRNQFFMESLTPLEGDAVEKTVGWTAFPRNIEISSASDEERWKRADASRTRPAGQNVPEEHKFDAQEEYCEWSVDKDSSGIIKKISFTCEDPYYWFYLWNDNPNYVLEQYKKHISPDVKMEDLREQNGDYKYINKWNENSKTGAMHMIFGANTIAAAIELVAAACVIRLKPDGTPITSARRIARCGAFADPNRHSDPSIYEAVNELAREGHFISMKNPAELAFQSISFLGWKTPDESDPSLYWKFTRGVEGHYQRGELVVPNNAGFNINDIKIDGKAIRYGAQIADKIRIKVTGVAHKLGTANKEPITGCTGVANEFLPQNLLEAINTKSLHRMAE